MNTEDYKEKTALQGKDRERFFLKYRINRFPDRLREAMDEAKIPSNNQLAKRTELSEATIRKYLKGETYPTLDRLALIADACSCSLAWLASGEDKVDVSSEKITEKFDNYNEAVASEFERILSYLTEEQREKLLKIIYTKGVTSILQLDDSLDSQFQALSREEQLRLLRLNEQTKKRASEGGELDITQSPASEDKRQAS